MSHIKKGMPYTLRHNTNTSLLPTHQEGSCFVSDEQKQQNEGNTTSTHFSPKAEWSASPVGSGTIPEQLPSGVCRVALLYLHKDAHPAACGRYWAPECSEGLTEWARFTKHPAWLHIRLSCHGTRPPLCFFTVHAVFSARFRIPCPQSCVSSSLVKAALVDIFSTL